MTVRVLKSSASKRNPAILEIDRKPGEDNLGWMRRVQPKATGSARQQSLLLLVGGNDPLSFRLRIAQAHVRHDLSPSAWSHVLFISRGSPLSAEARTTEISLAPPTGFGEFGYPIQNNGIQNGTLAAYISPELYPNIALLAVPVSAADIDVSLEDLKFQRSTLDCPELILKWLAYCWGVGIPASPLIEGAGIPAAAILEVAYAAKGFDLTPGLESRSSCPEAIWQAANWWQEYYEKRGDKIPISGAFTAKHDLVPDVHYRGSGAESSQSAGPSRSKRTKRSRK